MERTDAGTAGKSATGDPGAYRPVVAALLVVMLCGGSMARNSAWKSEAALLEDSIRKTPDKPRPYYNLGLIYSERHEYRAAAAMLTRSIELYQVYNSADNERSRDFHFNAYLNRGAAYAGAGLCEKALEDYSNVIFLRPDHAAAYRARGDCYRRAGNARLSEQDYRKACELGDEAACATEPSAGRP